MSSLKGIIIKILYLSVIVIFVGIFVIDYFGILGCEYKGIHTKGSYNAGHVKLDSNVSLESVYNIVKKNKEYETNIFIENDGNYIRYLDIELLKNKKYRGDFGINFQTGKNQSDISFIFNTSPKTSKLTCFEPRWYTHYKFRKFIKNLNLPGNLEDEFLSKYEITYYADWIFGTFL